MRNGDLQEFSSPFLDRLASDQPVEIAPAICAWSDLLGFAVAFTDSGWSPSQEQWRALTARVDHSYRLHLQNLCAGEFILLLNDGAVRTATLNLPGPRVGWVALWMRHVVKAHAEVNEAERRMGLPGTRTVVAAGVRAAYTFPEVRLQDFFYHYTRRNATGSPTSPVATEPDPLVVSNSQPLQLNTAFSKAYILDSYGSGKGIRGPGLFVDDSVFQALRSWSCDVQTLQFVEEDRGAHWFCGVQDASVKPPGRRGLLGFLCDTPPINIQEKLLSTSVRRVIRYFTDDEDWDEFSFDLS